MTVAADPQGDTLHLLAWLSPGFPVGAFAYSHGLESAVDAGDVFDAASLLAWLSDLIAHGSVRNDVILASAAWTAVTEGDGAALALANETALAMSPARERRLETGAMGLAFATAIRAAWQPDAAPPPRDIAYPVAFGAACGAQGLSRLPCLEAFGLAFVQNLVSAAVRLGPIGQTDGQRLTASLVPALRDLAATAAHSSLDELGGCALRSDIAAMRHETLYSRLFRS